MKRIVIVLVCSALLCAGCTAPTPVGDPEIGTVLPTTTTQPKSDPVMLPYEDALVLTSDAPTAEERLNCTVGEPRLPSGFAYSTAAAILSAAEKNTAYSPVSLWFALAMLAEGTTGHSKLLLEELMGVDGTQLSAHANSLYRQLYRDTEKQGKLLIANSLWMFGDRQFNPDYVSRIKQNYYADLMKTTWGETADAQMSQWVSDHTGGLIKPTFKTDVESAMELLNTIYFNAAWFEIFSDRFNTEEAFYLTPDKTERVTFMNRVFHEMTVYRTANATRVELGTTQGTMCFVLPDNGVSPATVAKDADSLQTAMTGGTAQEVKLTLALPKTDIRSEIELIEVLTSMGFGDLFVSPNPDLDGIIENSPGLMIRNIRQGSRVIWDENGVTAAAYTDIAAADTAMPRPQQELTLRFDRPFLFGVVSTAGDLLFTGVVSDPAE